VDAKRELPDRDNEQATLDQARLQKLDSPILTQEATISAEYPDRFGDRAWDRISRSIREKELFDVETDR
jgi:hypothetical protein